MSNIHITRAHSLSDDELREIAGKVGDSLVSSYGGSTRWQGDRLCYKLSSAEGSVEWDDRDVVVKVKLGMMMGMLKSAISSEIERKLDEYL